MTKTISTNGENKHFLINKKLTTDGTLVNPYYLNDDYEGIIPAELVFECVRFKELRRDTQNGMDAAKNVLYSGALDFLKDAVFGNLCKPMREKPNIETCIKDLIQSIPVYIVDKSIVGKKTENGVVIPRDTCKSIVKITLRNLKNKIKEKKLEDLDVTCLQKILGLYEMDAMDDRFYFLTSANLGRITDEMKMHRRIFLWIDNINAAAKDRCRYESLFFFVLCHEFMHALMDIYPNENLYITGANERETEIFSVIIEEALANGLALYLLKSSQYGNDDNQYDHVTKFVERQSVQYQMGLLFRNINVLSNIVPLWMQIKRGNIKINRDCIYAIMNRIIECWDNRKSNDNITASDILSAILAI